MLIPNNPSAVEQQDKPLSPKETKPAGIPSSSPNNTQRPYNNRSMSSELITEDPLAMSPEDEARTLLSLSRSNLTGGTTNPPSKRVEVSQSLSEEEFRRLQECVKANPEKSVPELTKLLYEEFNRDNSKNPVLQTTIQHWVSMFHLQR